MKWSVPRRIFVNSMSDMFHEKIPEDYIANVASIMRLADWHTYQVLTKRPERMEKLLTGRLKAAAVVRHDDGASVRIFGIVTWTSLASASQALSTGSCRQKGG